MSKKLNYEERIRIYKYRKQGLGNNKIGKELGRAGSTISRECRKSSAFVDRNQDYFTQARASQDATHARRVTASSSKIRLKSIKIQEYVEARLKKGDTPKIIAGRWNLLHPEQTISHEAIYQWLLEERPDLRVYLPIVGKCRRRRVAGRKKRGKAPAAPKTSIEQRPPAVENRDRIGDFEQDTIVCSQSTVSIMNITDRGARKVFLEKVASLESDPYSDALIARIKMDVPPEHRHTLTQDNGPENAKHQKVEKELGMANFFSHPYCASERGTVENRNGLARRRIPKGTDLSTVSAETLAELEDQMNNRPLGVLGYLTPNEVWDYAICHGGVVPKKGSDAFNEACLRIRHNELNRVEVLLTTKTPAQVGLIVDASLELAA